MKPLKSDLRARKDAVSSVGEGGGTHTLRFSFRAALLVDGGIQTAYSRLKEEK